MAKVIQGDGAEADPTQNPPGSGSSIPPTPETPPLTVPDNSDLTPLMAAYVQGLSDNLRNFPMTFNTFSPSAISPYVPYLRFHQSEPGHFGMAIRPLTHTEFLAAIRANTPKLGEVLELSDLMDDVPAFIDLSNDTFLQDHFPSGLALFGESGIVNVLRFARETQDYFLIPSLGVLSLFMKQGATFRKYLQAVSAPDFFYLCGNLRDTAGVTTTRVVASYATGEELFSVERLHAYLERGGKEVKGMMKEYSEIVSTLHSLKQNDNFPGILNYAFNQVKSSHPQLVL